MQRLVYGLQPVREVLRAQGKAVNRVLLEASASPTLDALERFARDRGVPTERVDRGTLERLTNAGRHQGVAADAPPLRILALDEVLIDDRLLALALDEVQDPQNFGAVIRSAVALADAPVLWGQHSSAPLTPATFRASAGAVEHARLVCVRSLRGALGEARAAGVQVVALDASATVDLAEVDLRRPTVLVIGSEGQGVRKGVRAEATTIAKLPMQGPLASLNASVAAALALYEAVRQRQEKTIKNEDLRFFSQVTLHDVGLMFSLLSGRSEIALGYSIEWNGDGAPLTSGKGERFRRVGRQHLGDNFVIEAPLHLTPETRAARPHLLARGLFRLSSRGAPRARSGLPRRSREGLATTSRRPCGARGKTPRGADRHGLTRSSAEPLRVRSGRHAGEPRARRSGLQARPRRARASALRSLVLAEKWLRRRALRHSASRPRRAAREGFFPVYIESKRASPRRSDLPNNATPLPLAREHAGRDRARTSTVIARTLARPSGSRALARRWYSRARASARRWPVRQTGPGS